MGQRSPHNARYQKHTKPEGKTRRSAASVKPKRDAGGTAQSSKSSSKKSSAKSKYLVPETPEYRKWRRVWWAALGGSAACALLFLGADYLARQGIFEMPPGVRFGLLAVCYVFLGIGMYVDWRKVRPAREAAIRGAVDTKPAKKTVDRPTDSSA